MSDRQWQTDIYTEELQETPDTFYGASLLELQLQVTSWLEQKEPKYLRSGNNVMEQDPFGGWKQLSDSTSDRMAYKYFCETLLDIRMGPEYEGKGFQEGKMQLDQIKIVAVTDEVDKVNLMLKRGWTILAVQTNEIGTWYHLGHTEPDAF